MRFMAIVKAIKAYEAGKPPNPELIAAMGKFSEEMQKLGVYEMGGGLQIHADCGVTDLQIELRPMFDGQPCG